YLDDRPTDGQAHPEATRLGAVKRGKDVDRRLGKPDAVVMYGNLDDPWFRQPARDRHPSHAARGCLYRLDCIAQQVEDDLLDLDAVAHHRRQIRREIQPDLDTEITGLALDHLHGFTHERIHVEGGLLAGLLAHQLADAPDDLPGAQGLVHHRL